MKTYKPYLSLSKNATNYELEVIVTTLKNQTITSIHQEEIKKDDISYWGVIITISGQTQLVNAPENPVFSSTVGISLDKSESYQKILCCTQIVTPEGTFGPAEGGSTSVDFEDGKK
jgi:hypothetical protein